MALPHCPERVLLPAVPPAQVWDRDVPPRSPCGPVRTRRACEAPGPVLPGGLAEGSGDNGEHFKRRLLMKHSRALVQWAIFHQACKEWLADGLKIQLNTFTDLSINIIFLKNNSN